MKKNGFTLVELLAVLVIIGILSAISITVYTNLIPSSRKELSDVQKNTIIDATRTYVAINTINFNNHFDNATIDDNICVAIKLEVLYNEGLLKKEVLDPSTNANLMDGYILVSYDNNHSQYEYTYKSKDDYTSKWKYEYLVKDGQVEVIEWGSG